MTVTKTTGLSVQPPLPTRKKTELQPEHSVAVTFFSEYNDMLKQKNGAFQVTLLNHCCWHFNTPAAIRTDIENKKVTMLDL